MGQDPRLDPVLGQVACTSTSPSLQIRLVDEQDSEILGGNGTVNFAEPPAGVIDIEAGAILVFDVPFPHPGAYRFEITIDGERKASVPLTVSQLPPPPAGGTN